MKVRVYYNIHKKLWSVQEYIPKKGWRVRHHVDSLILEDVTFQVSEAGRQRVIREKRKNVHAYATGTLVTLDASACTGDGLPCIKYNPYLGKYFRLNGLLALTGAGGVLFTAKRKLFSLTTIETVV